MLSTDASRIHPMASDSIIVLSTIALSALTKTLRRNVGLTLLTGLGFQEHMILSAQTNKQTNKNLSRLYSHKTCVRAEEGFVGGSSAATMPQHPR